MRYLFRPLFFRNLYAETLLENFLISAVTTILFIRFYLQVTGYPQIGGGNLHIAHMLYGGLLMMVTMFILFAFLNRTAHNVASVLGGVGFGFFIDELGKFLTRDNNYFFEPTIALIYVILIAIYLAGQALPKLKGVTQKEYLLNAVELLKEVVVQDLDTNEKKQALAYLHASDREEPIVDELKGILSHYRSKPHEKDVYTSVKESINLRIEKITQNRQFYFFVLFFIVVQSVLSLLITFLIIAALNRSVFMISAGLLYLVSLLLLKKASLMTKIIYSISAAFLLFSVYFLTTGELTIELSFIGWGTVLSSAFAAFVAFSGILELSKSQLRGLKLFRLSILISIFLTQFFLFYSLQFLALVGLFFNIIMLLTLEFVISKKDAVGSASEVTVKR
jgi:hypothetical protein